MSGGSKEQAQAARSSVLVVPAADRAGIVVAGKDRSSWLNGLVTCNLATLGPRDAAYGLLVEKKGRIQTDLFVVPSDKETVVLAVPSGRREELVAALDHYLIMEDAELSLGTLSFYVAHGPKAQALVGLASVGGAVDVFGTGGAVLACEQADKAAFEERLRSEVETLGGVMGDESGWEAVRIERGIPRFGVEVDTSFYPQEASLEKLAVSFDKGCYLGQEVVYMLQNRGHVKQKLVPLAIEGGEPPASGTEITTLAGDRVGEVRSSTAGAFHGTPAAIGMVKWAHANPGTELRVAGRVAKVGELA